MGDSPAPVSETTTRLVAGMVLVDTARQGAVDSRLDRASNTTTMETGPETEAENTSPSSRESSANGAHTRGNRELGQPRASQERVRPDPRYGVWNQHRRDVGAAPKRHGADRADWKSIQCGRYIHHAGIAGVANDGDPTLLHPVIILGSYREPD